MAKSQYKTKHYTEMLSFMESVPGQQMTVQEIYEGMKNQGSRYSFQILANSSIRG